MYKGLSVFDESADKNLSPGSDRPVIVLGIRSGTSMATEILTKLGYYMGEGFQDGNESNPRGFFEDAALSRTVVALGESVGADNIHSVPDTSQIDNVPFKMIRELKSTMDQIRLGREKWGMKRPGLLWYLNIVEMFFQPRYVLCTRESEHVGDSLGKHCRGVPQKTDYFRFAEIYFQYAKKYLESKDCLELRYKEVLSNPTKEIAALAEWLGIRDKGKVQEAVEVVNSDYNHHK